MRYYIIILCGLLISIGIGIQIAQDPGVVYFAYRHWTVEMPLWFAAFGALIVVLLLLMLCHVLKIVDVSWLRLKNRLKFRRLRQAHDKLSQSLIRLIESDWKHAEQDAISCVDKSDTPLIHFLTAAYAAHEQSAYERRDQYLQKAYATSKMAGLPVG